MYASARRARHTDVPSKSAKRAVVQTATLDTGWILHDHQQVTCEKERTGAISGLGSEGGTWSVLFRWKKGYTASPHKHLSGSHTFILSGKLEVRDGVLNAGDYLYEPNGMLHGETKALEDTEYLFISEGAVIFFDEEAGLTNYLGWEEWARLRDLAAS